MLSIIIPAFNEAENIKQTLSELINAISKTDYENNYEIIVVDDHSSDATFGEVTSLHDDRINCIRLSRRNGSHTAIRAGLDNSKGEVSICISADGQDDPEVLPKLLKKWKNGAHIVWALRKARQEPLHIKLFALLFYKLLSKLTSSSASKIDLSRADFYLLDKKVVEAINVSKESNTSLFGLIAWSGFKQDFVEYERRARRFGKSKWSFKSRMKLAIDWIVAFSGLPLKLVTFLGILVASIGFLYAIVVIINAFLGNPAQGWSSLMIVVLILGGVQMITLGVIGEYLWRNLDEARKRPLYFIEETTFDNDN
jgi:dolichol-phosphate mannosyltransferase